MVLTEIAEEIEYLEMLAGEDVGACEFIKVAKDWADRGRYYEAEMALDDVWDALGRLRPEEAFSE